MSQTHPPPPQAQQPPTPETAATKYATTLHRAALFSIIIAPALALLPPRKLDAYTLGLLGVTGVSANHLFRESRGRSILEVVAPRQASDMAALQQVPGDASLPTDRAREFQRQLRELREQERVARAEGDGAAVQQVEARQGILEKVYYGGERAEGWKERRIREDQEKLAEGKGYGDIIMEQIWDVWNWGKKEGESSAVGDVGREGGSK